MKQAGNISENSGTSVNEFLANERTFLAWIRTSIALMGFGFVIVKFSIFLRQISIVLGRDRTLHGHGYSAVIGVVMVALGSLTAIFAFLRYKSIEANLRTKRTFSSTWLSTLITLSIIVVSILLIIYLVPNI